MGLNAVDLRWPVTYIYIYTFFRSDEKSHHGLDVLDTGFKLETKLSALVFVIRIGASRLQHRAHSPYGGYT
jgi:hypothetical protein